MATYGSNSVGAFIIGGYSILGTLTDISDTTEIAVEDTTTLGDSWEESTATGGRRWSFDQSGFFDDAAGSVHAALSASYGTSRVGVLAYAGNTLGKAFTGFAGLLQAGYRIVMPNKALSKANGTYQGSGVREQGKILHPLGVKTTASASATTPVDNATSSAAGGAAYFETTALALDGGTSVTLKVKHSADDLTYVDLASSAIITAAPNGQRIVVAGTVNRYLKAAWVFNGTSGAARSVTFFAGFARY